MLIYLLVLHFVADFLLQSREMGQKKSSELMWLGKHLAIQLAGMASGLLLWNAIIPLDWKVLVLVPLLNTLVHGVIDWNIWRGYKLSVKMRAPDATPETWQYYNDHWFYSTIGFDQLLHTITLVLLVWWLV